MAQTIDLSSINVEIDVSNIDLTPEKQNLLDQWTEEYKAEVLTYFLEEAKNNSRKARYARLDASHDKMELRGESNEEKGEMLPVTMYLKRRK